MVTDEANNDAGVRRCTRPGRRIRGRLRAGRGAVYQQNTYDSSGDFRGIDMTGAQNVKFKKYQFGNIRFGTGGLVAGVAIVVVLAGGGAAAVVSSVGDSADLASAVGEWTQPSQQPMPGMTVSPIRLVITDGGDFTFSMKMSMDVPDAGSEAPPEFGDTFGSIGVECAGTVTPDGDHFTLRTTSGPCGTFEAKLGPDERVLDVFIENGSANGSLALSKSS